MSERDSTGLWFGILYDLGLYNDRICLERTGPKAWQTPRDGHMAVVGGG